MAGINREREWRHGLHNDGSTISPNFLVHDAYGSPQTHGSSLDLKNHQVNKIGSGVIQAAQRIDAGILRLNREQHEWETMHEYDLGSENHSLNLWKSDLDSTTIKQTKTKDSASKICARIISKSANLQLVQRTPMPSIVVEQFDTMQKCCFLGIFTDLQRAWIAIDTQLYLWSYSTSSNNQDITVCPDLSHYIVAVHLCSTPKQLSNHFENKTFHKSQKFSESERYFSDSVRLEEEYFLVTVTMLTITLWAVHRHALSGEIVVSETGIHANHDALGVLKVCDGWNGRIFLTARDGCLYEFVYLDSTRDGILPRPYVINRTRSWIGRLIPSSVRNVVLREDAAIEVVIDESRNNIYTLSESGKLGIYGLDEHWKRKPKQTSDSDRPVQHYASIDLHSSLDRFVARTSRAFLDVFCVEKSMKAPSNTHFVVTSSLGERFYYAVSPTKTSLRLIGWRVAPSYSVESNVQTQDHQQQQQAVPLSRSISSVQAHTSFWNAGTFVYADSRNCDRDHLIVVVPESQRIVSRIALPRASPVAESSTHTRSQTIRGSEHVFVQVLDELDSSRLDCKVWAIVNNTDARKRLDQRSNRTNSLRWSENTEEDDTASEIVVLSNASVLVFRRVSVTDRLRNALKEQCTAQDSVHELLEVYGVPEVSCACVALMVEGMLAVSARGMVGSTAIGELDALATAFFVTCGGAMMTPASSTLGGVHAPLLGTTSSAAGVPGVGTILRQSDEKTLSFGVIRFLINLFHDWWQSPFVFVDLCESGSVSTTNIKISLGKSRLQQVQKKLEAVEMLLSQASKFSYLRFNGNQAHGTNPPSMYMMSATQNGMQSPGYVQSSTLIDGTHASWQAEVGRLMEIGSLLRRSIHAIRLLVILCDYDFANVVSSTLEETQLQELLHLRFCEFAAGETGAWMGNVLIEALFTTFDEKNSEIGILSARLKEECGSFFDDHDAALHRGLSLLREAHRIRTSGMNPESALRIACTAAETFRSVSSKIVELSAVCHELLFCGAACEAIGTALQVEQSSEAINDISKVGIAKQCIMETVQACVLKDPSGSFQNAVGGSVVLPENVRKRAIDMALASGSDAYLHDLYGFLLSLGSEGTSELLKRPSVQLESYLQRTDKQLLWRYYALHGRCVEACQVLLGIAEDASLSLSLDDRIHCMASALHNARTAASLLSDPRANELIRKVSDNLDVAKVQLRAIAELERSPMESLVESAESERTQGQVITREDALRRLRLQLLDLSTMYNELARPWNLWETELDILRCASYNDAVLVQSLWSRIVHAEIDRSAESVGFRCLQQRILLLGRDFYRSTLVFPLEFLLDLLERISYLMSKKSEIWKRSPVEWVFTTFLEIGFDMEQLLSVYEEFFMHPKRLDSVEGMNDWISEPESILRLLTIAERLFTVYISDRMQNQFTLNGLSNSIKKIVNHSRNALNSCSETQSKTNALQKCNSIQSQLAITQ